MSSSQADGAAEPQFQRSVRPEAKIQRTSVAPLEPRKTIAVLGLFSAVSCFAGGAELMVWRAGGRYVPPLAVLAHTPFHTFLVPGILLACVVGGASLACAILVWRRARAAIEATVIAGGALGVWMTVEIATLRIFNVLSALYTLLGLLLLGLGVRAAWRAHTPRYRWLIVVTLAESCGFIAPAAIGIATSRAGIEGNLQALLVIGGGAIEGLVLGLGQGAVFPLPIRKLRYAAWTALGAAFAWASAMGIVALAAASALSTAASIAAGVCAGALSLCAMGAAQWMELRRHSTRARQWIAWTALAWVLALPLSFAPGPFVDETTLASSQIVLWGTGGLLMAAVMALVTWHGVRRVTAPHSSAYVPSGSDRPPRTSSCARLRSTTPRRAIARVRFP